MKKHLKRILAVILTAAMTIQLLPVTALAAGQENVKQEGVVSVSNDYIQITVNRENGGYYINTKEGDVIRKSDDNAALLHRGENFDTSFTSFQLGNDKSQQYIFGNSYGFLGLNSSEVFTVSDATGITSTWSVKEIEIKQRIELVNDISSEQLGTAKITYTLTNKGNTDISDAKARVLMDTMLGGNDSAVYEVAKPEAGTGYDIITAEKTISGEYVPADYFAKDDGFNPSVVAFGVNSILNNASKPSRMTFAHWVNIAATKFDYTPDTGLTFTNGINDTKTADSAAAMYYELGKIEANKSVTLSTYYGVTANLKNKANSLIINSTAPKKLILNDAGTAYTGEDKDNEFTIHTTISNTKPLAKIWKKIKAVVYTGGKLVPLSISDTGVVSEYDNSNPYAVEVLNFGVGESKPITFRFRATPSTAHELGSIQIKIFDVSETDVYVEENVIATSNNFILLPATVPNVPAITVTSAAPNILYNNDKRFLTITGKGLSNFNADGLQGIELRGNNGITYTLSRSCMSIAQDSESMTLMLDQYMEPGRYEIHFLWQQGTTPEGVDKDFTAPALWVDMTNDETYRNDKYGVLTMQRLSSDKSKAEYNKFKVISYDTEAAFKAAQGNNGDKLDGKLLITLRGEFIKDNIKENYYRAANNQKSISINGVLDYLGSDMTVYSENDNAMVKMNGKIITTGSRTTVRDGTADFKLKSGTTYIVPQYDDAKGEVVNDAPDFGQQYIELAWDSGMDVLQTIGGFALNLKFGVLGEMVHEVKEDTYEKVGNVVSFGGSLDLSFMTPGGAQVARENKSKNTAWSEEHPSKSALDNPLHETETFEVKPITQSITSPAASINVQDVLYGQHKEDGKIETGYIGINAQASATLPQIVSFLHETMSGSIDINTIGDYRVGVDGSAQLTNFALAFSFVIKEAPNGAPVPDKLYFMIGGFEPGVNIDSLGVFWVTGGGGGFDKLYDTIFSSDGIPPFTLLLTVQFDIFKIMTGQADLELSLRSLGITLSDVSLKMIKNAKFLDGGSVFIAWYPNFSLSMSAKVMFSQIFTGQMGLNASAAKNSFEMYMGVGVSLPQAIPIIGGMNIAYAEIGGGMEKMWGMLRILFIELGITYYWSSGDVNFGVKRSMSARTAGATGAYERLTAPQAIDYDETTKQTEYMSIGSNLDFAAGSGSDTSLSEADIASFKAGSQKGALKSDSSSSNKLSSSDLISSKASVQSNSMLTTHLLSLGQKGSKIISISTKDGKLPENFTDKIRIIKPDLSEYALTIYDGTNASTANANLVVDDGSKTDLNGTVIKNDHDTSATLYVTIPEASYMANNWLVEIGDISCDVGIIGVRPLAKLTAADANITNGNQLNVSWNGTDLEVAKVAVALTKTTSEGGIILSEGIDATAKQATLTVPDTISSGDYYVRVILSKEGECYNQYFTKYENGANGNKKVTVVNSKAPKTPASVSLSNAGNDKLQVTITKNADSSNLDGYMIDVYEDGALKQIAQYYDKDNLDHILIGGIYSVPVPQYNTNGTAKLDANGNPVTVSQLAGYTAGKKYKVLVRSAKKAADSETLYCSDTLSSSEVVLVKSTPAKISISSPMAGAKTIDNALWVNNGKAKFTLKSETDVTGVWSIDGQKGGEFTTAGKSFDINLDVLDGTHTIEFAGREVTDRDAFIYTSIIGVDSTAPVMLLDNPINGSVYSNNVLSVRGVVEADAYYTFKVDGKLVGKEKQNLSNYIDNNGLLTYPLMLGNGEVSRNVEIIASDSLGNQTTQKAEVINSEINKIRSVYIAQNGNRITGSGITLEEDLTNIDLQLIGVVPAEGYNARKTFDITGLTATNWDVLKGTADVESGKVRDLQAGEAYISASFGLTNNTNLSDAIPIMVASSDTGNTTPDDPGNPPGPQNNNNSAASQNSELDKLKNIVELHNRTWITDTSALTYEQLQSKLNTDGSITLVTEQGTVELPKSTLEGLKLKQGETLSLTVRSSLLPETDIAKCYYQVTLSIGDNVITNHGNVMLKLPCSSSKAVLTAFNMNDKGEVTIAPFSAYKNGEIHILTSNTGIIRLSESSVSYKDVPASFWGTKGILFASYHGLFSGVGKGAFNPNGKMTRGMLAAVLGKLFGVNSTEYEGEFTDVSEKTFYAPYVSWAAKKGLVTGVGNNKFNPDAPVTREQLMVILYNALNLLEFKIPEGTKTKFADEAKISSWAKNAVEKMSSAGVVSGKSGKLFDPQGSATRAEVANILMKFIESILYKE